MRKPRIPKVGEVVSIEWIDSGRDVEATWPEVKDTRLVRCTTHGRVADVDEQRVLLAMDEADELTEVKSSWGLIWIPSLVAVTRHT